MGRDYPPAQSWLLILFVSSPLDTIILSVMENPNPKSIYICIVPESEAVASGYETCHTLAVLVIFPKKVFFVLKEAPQRP